MQLAVVGAGWAGLACAVQAARQGWHVTVFEAARTPGGRARTLVRADGQCFDNGQHILVGAYRECLSMMRMVGVDPAVALARLPLAWRFPDGTGLSLAPGPPTWAFLRGVIGASGWSARDRLGMLRLALGWRLAGFDCEPTQTVADLGRGAPQAVLRDWLEPLCVAALNTPADRASGRVFLRVLRDAVFGGPGSSDLLLPRTGLSELFPEPAMRWLVANGQHVRTGTLVQGLDRAVDGRPTIEGHVFDQVVLATGATAMARLTANINPEWSRQCATLEHQAILTVYIAEPALRLTQPMTALRSGVHGPAQFVFDLMVLGHSAPLFAFVASAADVELREGVVNAAERVLSQARNAFPGYFGQSTVSHAAAERRATFACTPGLCRPGNRVTGHVLAAGDHLDGPYPATLEGAVRSGLAAATCVGPGLNRTGQPLV
ncbi:MAG: hydroxysqualene dehydroxylase HpnE [Aquabacterium sp.]